MIRSILAAISVATLAACSGPRDDVTQPATPIGDFRLGHNIVVANEPTQGPLSREASDEELEEAVRLAVENRFRRYDGDGLYHIGLKVEGYVLAQPGIPLVMAPQSVLLLAFNIWDNATQTRINPEPVRITAFEAPGGGVPLLPSGLTKSKEQQLENLAFNAARQVEALLRENEAAWFAPKPGQPRIAFPPERAATGDAPAPIVN